MSILKLPQLHFGMMIVVRFYQILKSKLLPVTIKKNGMLSSSGHLFTPQMPIPNMAM